MNPTTLHCYNSCKQVLIEKISREIFWSLNNFQRHAMYSIWRLFVPCFLVLMVGNQVTNLSVSVDFCHITISSPTPNGKFEPMINTCVLRLFNDILRCNLKQVYYLHVYSQKGFNWGSNSQSGKITWEHGFILSHLWEVSLNPMILS